MPPFEGFLFDEFQSEVFLASPEYYSDTPTELSDYPRLLERSLRLDADIDSWCWAKVEELLLDESQDRDEKLLSTRLPAGATYFGQFLAHDLSFTSQDPVVRKQAPENLRSPRADLDCLYGGGPVVSPILYSKRFPARFLFGDGSGQVFTDGDTVDLLRTAQGTSAIPDPRNDENQIIAQMHLALQIQHNRLVTASKRSVDKPREAFEAARNCLRHHYQWVIATDFLRLILHEKSYDWLLTALEAMRQGADVEYRLPLGKITGGTAIPKEFALAAFRYGHSMVRPEYHLSSSVPSRPLVPLSPSAPAHTHLLGGHLFVPGWEVDWRFFFDVSEELAGTLPPLPQLGITLPQRARKIDLNITAHLGRLPTPRKPLPFLTLRHGFTARLAGSHELHRALGEKPETPDQPLWTFVLEEAQHEGGDCLGPVGSILVAEVIAWVFQHDGSCVFRQRPDWKPQHPFGMAELIAGAIPDDEVLAYVT